MSERVRVLMVLTHPIQYMAPLARLYSADRRLDVTVAYCSMLGAQPGRDPEFGVEVAWDVPLLDGYRWVHVPNRSPRPRSSGFLGLFNPGLWRLVRRGRFDLVVCYGYRFASFWVAGIAAKVTGSAVVLGIDAHSMRPRTGEWKVPLKKVVVPRILKLADSVLVPSSRAARFVRDLGVLPDRVFMAPYVVDNALFERRAKDADRTETRRRWRVPDGSPVALFCGKLVPWKRPGDLLSVAERIHDLHVVFAGDGPLRAALRASASEAGLDDRVTFLGFVNQQELPSVYVASDFLVLPSAHEPFGLVVNDAFACGRPAVVSDACGSAGDLVRDGETGFVVPTGDLDALVDRCAMLVQDAALRHRLGRGAYARVQQWGPEQNARAFGDMCVALASERRGPRRDLP